jgi:FixJ family two-component response regulator
MGYCPKGQLDARRILVRLRRMLKTTTSIAIVDDDPSVLRALARLLRTSSRDAKTYGSAREFLDSLQDGVPMCLIADLQMPEMTGLDLQYHLKRHGIQIPTIIVTAHNEVATRQLCTDAGAHAYLLKPLQGSALIAAIDAAIGGA